MIEEIRTIIVSIISRGGGGGGPIGRRADADRRARRGLADPAVGRHPDRRQVLSTIRRQSLGLLQQRQALADQAGRIEQDVLGRRQPGTKQVDGRDGPSLQVAG